MAVKRLQALFTANATQAITEVERLATTVDTRTAAMGEKFMGFAKAVTLASVVAGAAIGAFAVKQAQEQEVATARLAQAVKNSGQSWYQAQKGLEAFDASMRQLGFDDAEAETSLAKLIPVTKNVAEAQNLMALAANVARGRHIDLDAATQLLVKVQTGHVALLGRIGIATKETTASEASLAEASLKVEQAQAALNATLKKHAVGTLEARTAAAALSTAQEKLTKLQKEGDGATISSTEALRRLAVMYGGDAAKFTETLSGKLQVMSAQVQEVGEKIGFFLIPILKDLLQALMDGAHWLKEHKDEAKALAIVLGTVVVSSILATVGAWAIAHATLILVTLALTEIVGTAVWFYTKWDQIWSWVKDHPAYAIIIGLLASVFAPFIAAGAVLGIFVKNWDDIWATVESIALDAIGAITDAWRDLMGFLGLADNSTMSGVLDAARFAAVHGNKALTTGTDYVGGRAAGGSVWPGNWTVGERGNGAELLHLNPGSSGYVTSASTLGANAGGDTYVFQLGGGVVTDRQFIDLVHEGLLRKNRQVGSLAFS